MKRLLPSLLLAGLVLAACGDSEKTKEAKTSYFITADNAARVTRLAFRTAALVGRHAAYPNGTDADAAPRACPQTGVQGKIAIVPSCLPDFLTPGAVDCSIEETYACPEVAGAITTTVAMRADQLSFTVNAAEYKEGTDTLGFIKYNGKVDALTKPDGSTTYIEDLAFIARGAGDAEDTIVTSTSEVTVTTDAAKLQFDGTASLMITGMGEGKVILNGVDFADCTTSPKTGTMDLALVGIERALVEFTGCGEATLHHFKAGVKADPEPLSADHLMSMFGQSITDVTNFKAVTANTEPSADALSPGRWCVPVGADTPNLSNNLGSTGTGKSMVFDAAATLATLQVPMLECLSIAPSASLGGAIVATHTVVADETGLGLFADPDQVSVQYASLATVTTAAGVTRLGYFARSYGTYGMSQTNFEAAGAGAFTNVANPADQTSAHGGTYYKAFQVSFDHLGARLVVGATEAYWFIRFF